MHKCAYKNRCTLYSSVIIRWDDSSDTIEERLGIGTTADVLSDDAMVKHRLFPNSGLEEFSDRNPIFLYFILYFNGLFRESNPGPRELQSNMLTTRLVIITHNIIIYLTRCVALPYYKYTKYKCIVISA